MPINPHIGPRTTRVTAANGTPTLLCAANQRRTYLAIKNVGANPVWIGPSTVTNGGTPATDGFQLATGATREFSTTDAGGASSKYAWYGNASTGASDCTVLEVID